jgi:hypothetical protein
VTVADQSANPTPDRGLPTDCGLSREPGTDTNQFFITKRKPDTVTYLCHFVALALPGESLVVERVVLRADVNGLPTLVRFVSLGDVEDVKSLADVGRHPLLGLGQRVAVRANFLMKWHRQTLLKFRQLQTKIHSSVISYPFSFVNISNDSSFNALSLIF